jgi:hypothetical protein
VRAFWLMILLSLALAVPGTAGAQTATDDTYDPVDVRVESRADTSGDLPYTGGDIALVVLAGAAILGTGLAIRRASST